MALQTFFPDRKWRPHTGALFLSGFDNSHKALQNICMLRVQKISILLLFSILAVQAGVLPAQTPVTEPAASLMPDEGLVYITPELLSSYLTVMLVIDPDTGVILDYSRGAAEFYGYPSLAGMNIHQLNTLSNEEIQHEMNLARTENRSFFSFQHRRADGSLREVQVNSYPMLRAGRSVLVSRIRDVTDEIASARQAERLKRVTILVLTLAVLVLALLFFLLSRLLRSRNRAHAEVRRQLAEKDLLLKEVHHRIKNNMCSIEQLLVMQLAQTDNDQALSMLQDAIGRIKPMTVLYDKLLNAGCYTGGSVKGYLEGLIESIRAVFPHNEHVSVVCRIADFTVHPAQLFSIGIILNELFTNIMKYAFPVGADGIVTVFAELTQSGEICIEIQDNGQGLPDGFDLACATGFGLTIVKMLCQQYRGSFVMENRQGTLARVRLQAVKG